MAAPSTESLQKENARLQAEIAATRQLALEKERALAPINMSVNQAARP